jgi:hypothetical protein
MNMITGKRIGGSSNKRGRFIDPLAGGPGGDDQRQSVFFQWLLANFRLNLNIKLEMQSGTEL